MHLCHQYSLTHFDFRWLIQDMNWSIQSLLPFWCGFTGVSTRRVVIIADWEVTIRKGTKGSVPIVWHRTSYRQSVVLICMLTGQCFKESILLLEVIILIVSRHRFGECATQRAEYCSRQTEQQRDELWAFQIIIIIVLADFKGNMFIWTRCRLIHRNRVGKWIYFGVEGVSWQWSWLGGRWCLFGYLEPHTIPQNVLIRTWWGRRLP